MHKEIFLPLQSQDYFLKKKEEMHIWQVNDRWKKIRQMFSVNICPLAQNLIAKGDSRKVTVMIRKDWGKSIMAGSI